MSKAMKRTHSKPEFLAHQTSSPKRCSREVSVLYSAWTCVHMCGRGRGGSFLPPPPPFSLAPRNAFFNTQLIVLCFFFVIQHRTMQHNVDKAADYGICLFECFLHFSHFIFRCAESAMSIYGQAEMTTWKGRWLEFGWFVMSLFLVCLCLFVFCSQRKTKAIKLDSKRRTCPTKPSNKRLMLPIERLSKQAISSTKRRTKRIKPRMLPRSRLGTLNMLCLKAIKAPKTK